MESNRVEALRARVEAIWKEILEMPDGQTQATFFELKGDSISAIRLVSRIEEELDVLLDVGDLFEDDPDLETFVSDVVARAERPAA
jgi:acyl carrier protein